jgi:hypothetical protein
MSASIWSRMIALEKLHGGMRFSMLENIYSKAYQGLGSVLSQLQQASLTDQLDHIAEFVNQRSYPQYKLACEAFTERGSLLTRLQCLSVEELSGIYSFSQYAVVDFLRSFSGSPKLAVLYATQEMVDIDFVEIAAAEELHSVRDKPALVDYATLIREEARERLLVARLFLRLHRHARLR